MTSSSLHKSARIFGLAALSIAGALPALAVDCRSVGGHVHGEPAFIVRHATLDAGRLTLTGGFDHDSVLSCSPLAAALWCKGADGDLEVTAMANGSSLLEAISDRGNGREQVGLAYECEGPLK